jgi:hypothetical protein
MVGRPELTQEGWWMAAVLACGPGAALSHFSAAALWGITKPRRGPIEVSVPAHVSRQRKGIIVHRRDLTDADVTTKQGIPLIAVVPTRTSVTSSTQSGCGARWTSTGKGKE